MNFKVRLHNPVWWTQMFLSILLPVLGYFGMQVQDLTTWSLFGEILFKALGNPFVVGTVLISLWNACNDPTTKGFKDSARAMGYDEPM